MDDDDVQSFCPSKVLFVKLIFMGGCIKEKMKAKSTKRAVFIPFMFTVYSAARSYLVWHPFVAF